MTKIEMQDFLRHCARQANELRPALGDMIDDIDMLGIKGSREVLQFLRVANHSARLLAVSAIAASDLLASKEPQEDGTVIKEWDFTKD